MLNHPNKRPSLMWKININPPMRSNYPSPISPPVRVSYPSSIRASHLSPMRVSSPLSISPLVRVIHFSLINNHLVRGLLTHWGFSFKRRPSTPHMPFQDLIFQVTLAQVFRPHLWFLGLNTKHYDSNTSRGCKLFVKRL